MKDFLIRLFTLTREELQQIEETVAELPVAEAVILYSQVKQLHGAISLGHLRATNPGVPIDDRGRLMQCSSCGTTENLHDDYGSGGPYRCSSPDCVMF